MEEKRFKKLYSDLALADEKGSMLPLDSKCLHHENCWQKIQNKKPVNEWTITRPYVGEKYPELKLLVMGINMNNYGNYEAAINLIKWSKEELKQGKIKMFVGKNYRGTFLFHRMGSYITSIAEKKGANILGLER